VSLFPEGKGMAEINYEINRSIQFQRMKYNLRNVLETGRKWSEYRDICSHQRATNAPKLLFIFITYLTMLSVAQVT
jgi:hypothetical protein